jgi:hypothetical protein
MSKPSEFYEIILDGLGHLYDSAFVRDILHTIEHTPGLDLAYALNKNQIRSKRWIREELLIAAGGRFGRVVVLGGWYGVLGALLLDDRRFTIGKVISVDIEPDCARVARLLNRRHRDNGRFEALVADIYQLDLPAVLAGPAGPAAPDLVICTSCEHLQHFVPWYVKVPIGTFLVLQSNNYFELDEHVNCVTDLAAFKAQAPLSELLFEGELRMKRYSRFMLIGRK